MAKLYISEFQFMGANDYGALPIARQPAVANQAPVDFTGVAAPSAAFGGNTTVVRVWSDTKCCVRFGASPTATVADMPLAANTTEYFGVTPGQKVSAIVLP